MGTTQLGSIHGTYRTDTNRDACTALLKVAFSWIRCRKLRDLCETKFVPYFLIVSSEMYSFVSLCWLHSTRSVPLYIPPLTFPQPITHTQKHTTIHSIHRHTTYHSSIQYRYGITTFLYPMLMPEHTLTVCNWHCIGGLWSGGNGNNITAILMCGYRNDRYLYTVQSE